VDIAYEASQGRLASAVLAGEIALILNLLAFFGGFYRRLPLFQPKNLPSFGDLLFVFLTFFMVNLIVIPACIYLYLSFQAGSWLRPPFNFSNQIEVWVNGAAIWLSALGIWGACALFCPTALQSVVGNDSIQRKRDIFFQMGIGAVTWFLCYPIVVFLTQFLTLLAGKWLPQVEVDQAAVSVLKRALDDPFQLAFYFFDIILVVPLIEEFMFRGTLQRWLIGKIGRVQGIVLTSLCFAAMHFNGLQGMYNLLLLPSLFVLSCYLGYLYERQGSLWAPIGLHGTFNFVSACMVIYQGE
jgi:uncharacterized protein